MAKSVFTAGRWRPWKILAYALLVAAYFSLSWLYASRLESWLDEGNYLIRSWWYASGEKVPYGNQDATWYMPIYYHVLGAWQLVFGKAHLAARILSTIFGFFSVLLLSRNAAKICKAEETRWLSILFLLTAPFSIFYYSTVTPIALVSLLWMVVLYCFANEAFFRSSKSPWAIGVLLACIYLTRSSMVLGIPFFLAAFIWLEPQLRAPRLLKLGLAFVLPFALATVYFEPKFTFFLIQFPILTPWLEKIGWISNPYPWAWFSYIWPSTGSEVWNEKTLLALWDKAVVPHVAVLFFNLVALVDLGRRIKEPFFFEQKLQAVCVASFFSMFVAHFFVSQSYCHSCIEVYSQYFYPIGCVSAAYGFLCLVRFLSKFFRGRSPAIVLAGLAAVLLTSFGVTKKRSEISQQLHSNYFPVLREVTSFLERQHQVDSEILVLGGVPFTPQACHLAGKPFSQISINYYHSYREAGEPIPASKLPEAEAQLNALNLWTGSMMQKWIETKYQWILYVDGAALRQWKPLIEKNFDRVAVETIPGLDDLELFRRK